MMRLPVCAGLLCILLGAASPVSAVDFVRGDANGDGVVSISDAYYHTGYLFLGRAPPQCESAADADDNGVLNFSDALGIIQAEFEDGPPPAAPFPTPGSDPTNPEALGCVSSGTGSPYEDPAARLEVLDVTAPGGNDRKVVLTVAISNSVEIAGYSGRIRDEAGVLDLEEGLSVERREVIELEPGGSSFLATRVVDGMIEYAAIFHMRKTILLYPGEGVSILELGVCLKPGTPAGEYALSVVDGEFIAGHDDNSGRAIHPLLQSGTLTVTSEVEATAGCDPTLYPPPPPINIAFELDEGTGSRGGDVTIPFSILADRASQGFTYSIHFDEAILEATGTDKLFLGGDGSPYEFEKFEINNETGFLVGAAITSLTDTEDVLPPSVKIPVLEFDFHIDASAPLGSTTIEFLDGGQGTGGTLRNKLLAGGQDITPDVAESFVFVNGLLNIIPDGTPFRNFLRGDSNRDEGINISDASYTLNYLFRGGSRILCLDAADANDDGRVDLSDPIATLQYLFIGDTQLPSPRGAPGLDLTPDNIGCDG